MDLCYAAQKYILPDLVAKCLQYVKDVLCLENIFLVLEFIKLFEDASIKVILKYIFIFIY